MNNQQIYEIEKIIGYSYKDKDLLMTAFTHSSYANENNCQDYERLEFLGDSLLESITTIFLYNNYHKNEGDLSKTRAKVVSATSLSKVIMELGLDRYIRVGGSIGREIPVNIIADVFEGIVASLYLDGGIEEAKKFVNNKLIVSKDNVEDIINSLVDYKSTLQEKLQAIGLKAKYEAREIKTDTNLLFEVSLVVNDVILATHVAMSKKLAEQACAKQILDEKGGKNIEF